MTETTYTVSGMNCEHCKQTVTAELTRLPGVGTVRVDVAGGSVTVTSSAPLARGEVEEAIDEAGYSVVG